MLAPFAAAEARATQAVFRHLANALASLHGGDQVPVIFDNAYARGDVGALGMASTQPAITLPTAAVPASPRGKTAVVTSTLHGTLNFKIVDHEPDGTGVSVLFLEKSA